MLREEVLAVESRLQISFHLLRGPLSRRLSVVMVVQLEQPWLEDGVSLLMRVKLKGSHSRSHNPQSRLRRECSLRRQSQHLSHSYAALVVLVPR